MRDELMALITIVTIIVAFGILFVFEPTAIDVGIENMLIVTLIVSFSALLLVFVMGTVAGLRHKHSKRKGKKLKLDPKIKVAILLGTLLIALFLAVTLKPDTLELNIPNLVMANLLVQSITLIMLSVSGTIENIRDAY